MKLFKLLRKSNKKSFFRAYSNTDCHNKPSKSHSLTKIGVPLNEMLNTNGNSGYAEIAHIKPRFRDPNDPLPSIPSNSTVKYLELDFDNHNTKINSNDASILGKIENAYESIEKIYLAIKTDYPSVYTSYPIK